jgi:outer membrane scaffolding protein for murein synthesis (MipA/OmpV family)
VRAAGEKEIPLWEAGLFSGFAVLPEYPGADEYDQYYLPLPYFIYRGKRVEADRSKFHGVIHRSKEFEVKMTFSGHPPVDDGNEARRGMDELDPLLSPGPEVNIFAINEEKEELYLHLVALQAISIDPDGPRAKEQGQTAKAQVLYVNESVFGNDRLEYGLRLGLYWSSDRNASYFYDVGEEDALPDRPAYDAGGGYGGSVVSQSIGYKVSDRLQIASFVRWYNFDGAAFEHSPLVKENNNLFGGVGFVWKFRESKKMIRY